MSSEDEIVRFTLMANRRDERFGIRRRCVDLNLRRTNPNSILHGSDQLQDNPVSDFRFDLPDPCSAVDIFRVLLQSGVEHSYCPVLAGAIEHAVENLLQLGIRWFYLMVDAQIMYDSERRGGASEEEMQTLQRIKGGDLKREDECSICLEGLSDSGASHREEEIIKMPCSHLFHQTCIFTWLHTKNSCPICRQVPFPRRNGTLGS